MFIFPVWLFNPTEIKARINASVISGGVALSGEEDVIATDGGGRWEIEYSGITIRTPAQQRAWSAWQSHLAGGATDCLVPMLSISSANRSSHGKSLMRVSKLVRDDEVWATEAYYSNRPIEAHLTTPAAARATSLSIAIDKGAPLSGGECLSIGSRAYKVVRPVAASSFLIDPPLREAVSLGADCAFDFPLVKCRMSTGLDAYPSLRFARFGEASISFVENPS